MVKPKVLNLQSKLPVVRNSVENGVQDMIATILAHRKIGKTFVVNVGGQSCAGKSAIIRLAMTRLPEEISSNRLRLDDYYNDGTTREQREHPESQDLDLAEEHVASLVSGKKITKPLFDFATDGGKRVGTEEMSPPDVLFVDGLWSLRNPVAKRANLRVYASSRKSRRLERLVERDTQSRSDKTPTAVREVFMRLVRPQGKLFVRPTRPTAHLVIRNNAHVAELAGEHT